MILTARGRRSQVSAPLGLSMQVSDDNKLFVGGLPWALDSDDLREVPFPPANGPAPSVASHGSFRPLTFQRFEKNSMLIPLLVHRSSRSLGISSRPTSFLTARLAVASESSYINARPAEYPQAPGWGRG